MNDDRDPRLLAIFSAAEADLPDTEFAQGIMRTIDRQRYRTLAIWGALVVGAVACIALFAMPVLQAVQMASSLLPNSLVSVEADWLRQLLAPVNSVAAAIAVGFLALRKAYRRLFR